MWLESVHGSKSTASLYESWFVKWHTGLGLHAKRDPVLPNRKWITAAKRVLTQVVAVRMPYIVPRRYDRDQSLRASSGMSTVRLDEQTKFGSLILVFPWFKCHYASLGFSQLCKCGPLTTRSWLLHMGKYIISNRILQVFLFAISKTSWKNKNSPVCKLHATTVDGYLMDIQGK